MVSARGCAGRGVSWLVLPQPELQRGARAVVVSKPLRRMGCCATHTPARWMDGPIRRAGCCRSRCSRAVGVLAAASDGVLRNPFSSAALMRL